MVCFEVQCLGCIVAHYFFPMNCSMLREPFQKWVMQEGPCSLLSAGWLFNSERRWAASNCENYNEMEQSSKKLEPVYFCHLLLVSLLVVSAAWVCGCQSPKVTLLGHFSSQRIGLAQTRNIFKLSSLALKMAPAVMCGSALIAKLKFPLVFTENNDKRNLYLSEWWMYLLFHLVFQ